MTYKDLASDFSFLMLHLEVSFSGPRGTDYQGSFLQGYGAGGKIYWELSENKKPDRDYLTRFFSSFVESVLIHLYENPTHEDKLFLLLKLLDLLNKIDPCAFSTVCTDSLIVPLCTIQSDLKSKDQRIVELENQLSSLQSLINPW